MYENRKVVTLHPELRAPTKRTRANDIIRAAINEGKPLPLTVLLESMWKWRDEAISLEDSDPRAAHQCRLAAVAVAEKAAPYVHPKLANIALRPEDEDEAAERRTNQRLSNEQLRAMPVTELSRLYLAVAKGEDLDVVTSDGTTTTELAPTTDEIP